MEKQSVINNMVNESGIEIESKIPFLVFREGDMFVAYSPALDLSSCGKTELEARKMLAEAAKLFLEEIVKMGTAEDVLTECGWRQAGQNQVWSPPTYKQDFIQIADGAD